MKTPVTTYLSNETALEIRRMVNRINNESDTDNYFSMSEYIAGLVEADMENSDSVSEKYERLKIRLQNLVDDM